MDVTLKHLCTCSKPAVLRVGGRVRDHVPVAALLALTVQQINVWTKAGCTAMTTFLFRAAQLIDI